MRRAPLGPEDAPCLVVFLPGNGDTAEDYVANAANHYFFATDSPFADLEQCRTPDAERVVWGVRLPVSSGNTSGLGHGGAVGGIFDMLLVVNSLSVFGINPPMRIDRIFEAVYKACARFK